MAKCDCCGKPGFKSEDLEHLVVPTNEFDGCVCPICKEKLLHTWLRLSKQEALKLFRTGNVEVYRLYSDGSEGLVESEEEINDGRFNDYDYGVELA